MSKEISKATRWRKSNPERALAVRQEERKKRTGDPFGRMLARLYTKAKKRGSFVKLNRKYLEDLYGKQGGMCALTGRRLLFSRDLVPDMITIDRISPESGYVVGNVRFVTHQVNAARGGWTDDQLVSMCADVLNRS